MTRRDVLLLLAGSALIRVGAVVVAWVWVSRWLAVALVALWVAGWAVPPVSGRGSELVRTDRAPRWWVR